MKYQIIYWIYYITNMILYANMLYMLLYQLKCIEEKYPELAAQYEAEARAAEEREAEERARQAGCGLEQSCSIS